MSYYRNGQNSNMGPSSFDYSTFTNSPLSQNAMLSSNYNNLNLSTRSNPTSSFNSASSTSGPSGFYPTPRASNLSPNLNFASLYSNRARFNASKGFDLEDDLEFCPEINESYSHLHSSSQNFTHHKFNPYTCATFSPQVSPTSANALTTSPVPKTATNVTTPTSSSLGERSPRVITPRAKKVLEIVNPVTGLRVSSPAPYK